MLELFNYQDHAVRVVTRDGEPWFVASDVCAVLEHSNPAMAVKGLDEDERGVSKVYTPSGDQNMIVISESGLYSLVLRSNKDEAKKFKRWITHEVIPSIRKTGSYGTPRELSRLELIDLARESELGRLEAEKKNAELEYQLRLQEPKVVFADAVTVSQNCILIRELSTILKQNGIDIGQNRLFEWMRENGYLIKRHGQDRNTPTQKAMELGLFEVKWTPVLRSDGSRMHPTTKVTGKGQLYFVNKFKSELLKQPVGV